ncbi:MAG: hypothetical protein IID44_10125 [Planctomycetes bacterium]|nr:hypothetical protein [Planctomycetota bacterium]
MKSNPAEAVDAETSVIDGASPQSGRPRRWWNTFKSAIVFLFVSWHLFFLATRSSLDLGGDEFVAFAEGSAWWESAEPVYQWTSDTTSKYETALDHDQGWSMFTSPLARGCIFLAVRVEFTDGSHVVVRSENEPDDPSHFFRIGRPRQRKLEDWLVSRSNDERRSGYRRPLWEQTARRYLRRWQGENPNDPRTPQRLVMLCRRIAIPKPDEAPGSYREATVREVATFDADGNLLE